MRVKFRSGINSGARGGFHVRYFAGAAVFIALLINLIIILWLQTLNRNLYLLVSDCNNIIESADLHGGIIESPDFPDTYPHNRNCTWAIKAPLGNNISATFSHFHIEDPNHRGSCVYDYIEFNQTNRNGRVRSYLSLYTW